MLRCVIFNDTSAQLRMLWKELDAATSLDIDINYLEMFEAKDLLTYARMPHVEHSVYFIMLNDRDVRRPIDIKLCQDILRCDKLAYVVFVSPWSQHALACCQAHAFDFLVVPFELRQFSATLDAVIQDIKRHERIDPLIVKTVGRVMRIEQGNILYFTRDRDYVKTYSLHGELRWRESFTSLLKRIRADMFLRVHNSYIVNINHIVELNLDAGIIYMSSGDRIPYSRRNEQYLIIIMKQYANVAVPIIKKNEIMA